MMQSGIGYSPALSNGTKKKHGVEFRNRIGNGKVELRSVEMSDAFSPNINTKN